MFSRAQRIHGNRGLVLVILAPVDKDLAGAESLLHVRYNEVRMLLLQQLCERVGEKLRLVKGCGSIQRNIELHSLRTRRLREALKAEMFENLSQPNRHLAALNDVRGWAGVKVERHYRR